MPELIRSVVSRMRIYVKDRRRSPRLRVRLLFSVSVCRQPNGNGLSQRGRPLRGHTRDLSMQGLALNVPQIHVDFSTHESGRTRGSATNLRISFRAAVTLGVTCLNEGDEGPKVRATPRPKPWPRAAA